MTMIHDDDHDDHDDDHELLPRPHRKAHGRHFKLDASHVQCMFLRLCSLQLYIQTSLSVHYCDVDVTNRKITRACEEAGVMLVVCHVLRWMDPLKALS